MCEWIFITLNKDENERFADVLFPRVELLRWEGTLKFVSNSAVKARMQESNVTLLRLFTSGCCDIL